ncbi:MAG: hypothetical protein HY288_14625 [Planctomycetia bacterium]|nr:hypothetical protein [Planctomycetia bacterium]
MAISATHYYLIRELFERGLLPRNGALLEIGEANWYGNVSVPAIVGDIKKFVNDPDRREALIKRLMDIAEAREKMALFDMAKVFYELFFAPSEVQAVDFEGSQIARKLDLNCPIQLNRRFDVVINHGTAEHIFNIAQVFKTIHDYTVPGGMMIHESPFTGWIDHGFYNLQPTFFFDMAEFNRYAIRGMFIEDINAQSLGQIRTREDVYELAKSKHLPENSLLFTILIKSADDSPFQIPIQGYYRQALPERGMAAWRDLR